MHITRNAAIKEPFEQVPLIIGLVGHRYLRREKSGKLRDAAILQKCIREIILGYRMQFPETPIVLMTALAEGADRLGAEVALDLGAQKSGVHLVAVLPMPPEYYQLDFQGRESTREFHRLHEAAAAAAVWVMDWQELTEQEKKELKGQKGRKTTAARKGPKSRTPPPRPATLSGDKVPLDTDGRPVEVLRHKQYAAAGKYIAVNSHILIALWDGVETELHEQRKGAGTSYIIECRKAAIAEAAKRLQHSDPCGYGPFFHIVTPRKGDDKAAKVQGVPFACLRHEPFPNWRRPPDETGHGPAPPDIPNYQKIYLAIEDFNREVARVGTDPGADIVDELKKKSAEYLYPGDDPKTGAEPAHLPASLRWMRRLFATADTLANRYQRNSHGFLAGMILLAAMAGAALDLVHGLHGMAEKTHSDPMKMWAHGGMLAFIIASIAVFWCFLRTLDQRHQDCYLAYRSLAETLRVQFFWKIFGLKKTVALHFEGRDFAELDWIRSAGDIAWRVAGAQLGADGGREYSTPWERYQRVVRHWIEDQLGYFKKAFKRDGAWLHLHEAAVGWCVRGAFGVALFCLLGTLCSMSNWPQWPLPGWCHAIIASAVAINALLLFLNFYACSPLGEKAPAKDASCAQTIAYRLRRCTEWILGLFAGVLEVPRAIRRETSDARRQRWQRFCCGVTRLVLLLSVVFVVVMFLAPSHHNPEFQVGPTADPAPHSIHATPPPFGTGNRTPGPNIGRIPATPAPASDPLEYDATPAQEFEFWANFAAITSIGFSLLAAGLFHFHAYRNAYEAHAESYQSMAEVFAEALTRLQSATTHSGPSQPSEPPPNAGEVLLDLGKAALAENSNWAAIHHSRPLEPPLG